MKEQADGVLAGGFKVPEEGKFYLATVQPGIGYIPGQGGEGVWQDEKGNKAWKFDFAVAEGEYEGCKIGLSLNEDPKSDRARNKMAGLFDALGFWKTVCERFPGDDVTVFDQRIMNGAKTTLPGKSCMVSCYTDKKGFARVKRVVSVAEYNANKDKLDAEAADGVQAPKGEKSEAKSTAKKESKASTATTAIPDGW
jgi:hypothetical protein